MLVVSVLVAGLLVTAAVSGLFYCICFASGLRVALYQSGVCSLLAFFYSAQKVELHKKLSVLQRFACSIHPGGLGSLPIMAILSLQPKGVLFASCPRDQSHVDTRYVLAHAAFLGKNLFLCILM